MILIDDGQIINSANFPSLIRALRGAFRRAQSMPARTYQDLPGGDSAKLLLMPCWDSRNSIGVKVLTVIPQNAFSGRPTINGAYVLMDGRTGVQLAVLSAAALTAVRTAAVCALSASILSRDDAKVLLMIGTGALASHLVRAYMTVRAIDRVIIWGRTANKVTKLRCALSDLPARVEVAEDLSHAIRSANIICSATFASDPLIYGEHVLGGTHIDLVGSFTPEMREADSELFRRARLIVDTSAAFEESGDLIIPIREGILSSGTPDLAALLRSPRLGRANLSEITVFKTVGTGLADLTVANEILRKVNRKRASPREKI